MKEEKKFHGLDTLRAIAISLVLLFHYLIFQHPAWWYDWFQFGWVGVDLFFVLSGFLISNQLFAEWQTRNKIDFRRFYLKRFFRILPPYIFILLIYIFFPAFHEREQLPPLWKMLTFTQNFNQDISIYGTFSHAWSLCVEEQFYLILPAILVIVLSRGSGYKTAWLIPGMMALTLVLRWIIWHFYLYSLQGNEHFWVDWYKQIYYPTYTRLDSLVIGVGIACAYRFRTIKFMSLARFANALIPVGVLLFACCYFISHDAHSARATIFSFSLIAIAFGFLVVSALLPGSFLFRFNSSITRNLATLSYSIYLSHKGIIHLTQKYVACRFIPADGILMFILCICFCIIAALLMRVLIEKPSLELRNRIFTYFNKLSPSK